ncbi:hypothetical protein V1478_009074 [Vespula squamosa]|uniref:Uncharacterized protein n=1 Tax=Vespula squamosa TaxID=30214 RepID=A0ABD2AVB6_VESSQ
MFSTETSSSNLASDEFNLINLSTILTSHLTSSISLRYEKVQYSVSSLRKITTHGRRGRKKRKQENATEAIKKGGLSKKPPPLGQNQ